MRSVCKLRLPVGFPLRIGAPCSLCCAHAHLPLLAVFVHAHYLRDPGGLCSGRIRIAVT